jgi:hypothetical protein
VTATFKFKPKRGLGFIRQASSNSCAAAGSSMSDPVTLVQSMPQHECKTSTAR